MKMQIEIGPQEKNLLYFFGRRTEPITMEFLTSAMSGIMGIFRPDVELIFNLEKMGLIREYPSGYFITEKGEDFLDEQRKSILISFSNFFRRMFGLR